MLRLQHDLRDGQIFTVQYCLVNPLLNYLCVQVSGIGFEFVGSLDIISIFVRLFGRDFRKILLVQVGFII